MTTVEVIVKIMEAFKKGVLFKDIKVDSNSKYVYALSYVKPGNSQSYYSVNGVGFAITDSYKLSDKILYVRDNHYKCLCCIISKEYAEEFIVTVKELSDKCLHDIVVLSPNLFFDNFKEHNTFVYHKKNLMNIKGENIGYICPLFDVPVEYSTEDFEYKNVYIRKGENKYLKIHILHEYIKNYKI